MLKFDKKWGQNFKESRLQILWKTTQDQKSKNGARDDEKRQARLRPVEQNSASKWASFMTHIFLEDSDGGVENVNYKNVN